MVKNYLSRSFAFAACLLGAMNANAQFAFTNSNSLISAVSHSGCAMSVADINSDGMDDIVKMDASTTLVIDMQNQNGTYTHYSLGVITTGGSRVWGMALGDADHNGWMDVATGSNGQMYLCKLGWSGSTITMTKVTLAGSYFVQNITWGDFDNDGWLDLAVCDDNDYMKIYKNNGSGTLNSTTTLINTNINPGMTYSGDPYDSGNYGSLWLDIDNDGDLDLYIAHCRQSTSSYTDQRRRDRLFKNNGSGVFTEAAASTNIEPVGDFKQSWTSSFGDLDNDGDQDVVMTNHGENSQIFRNNGTGVFTDVSAGSGFSTSFDAIESTVEDFDNDGWMDILVSGPGLVMYKNNHDGTYTSLTGVFGGAMSSFLSFATGDLNHDGFIDMEASYGSVYNTPTSTNDVLWLNNKNSNHFITFDLTGTVSNHDAIGTKVTITGSFGTQVREVRSGDSYGTSNSLQLHFGLGASTSITSATIEWPAGGTTNFGVLAADQFVTVVESSCSITGNTIPGPYVMCTGGSLTLNANAGYSSYLWNTGATTPSITTSTGGGFSVMVTSGACTNLSPTVTSVLNPNETPTVSASGANSCAGTAVLSSSTASSYSWTGPGGFTATTQNINPPTSGNYAVTITGTCQNWTSAPYNVTVLAATAPTGTGASGVGPATFNLSAAGAGTTKNWYDLSTGGTLLGTGTSFTTPVIGSTTTYYVDDQFNYSGATSYTGQKYHSGGSAYSSTTINGGLDFNVTSNCTLQTVKVYTGTTGTREIQLKNSGGTVINSLIVNVTPDTMLVTLNFPLTAGTGYRLTTNGSLNTTNFGSVSPALQRSSSGGVSYPYSIAGLVSITNGWTGSATSSSAYYYFYDWKVQAPTVTCTSARTAVTATVTGTTGITAGSEANGVSVYPNPANDEVNVLFHATMDGRTEVSLIDIAGRIVRTLAIENAIEGQTAQMDVTDLSAGTYMINIKTDTRNLVQRLMLTK